MDIKKGVQEIVNKIYAEVGEVRPSALVDAARPKSSPAHNAFEWDDSKAGEEYRLIQARTWIRTVEIIIDEQPERLIHVPSIVRDKDGKLNEREGYYKPGSVLIQNRVEFDVALDRVRSRMDSTVESYEYLKGLSSKSKTGGKAKSKVRQINFRQADKGFAQVRAALGSSSRQGVAG